MKAIIFLFLLNPSLLKKNIFLERVKTSRLAGKIAMLVRKENTCKLGCGIIE